MKKSRRGISEKVARAILATLAQGPRPLGDDEMQDCAEFMQELMQEQEEWSWQGQRAKESIQCCNNASGPFFYQAFDKLTPFL